MLIFLALVVIVILAIYQFMRSAQFGRPASGDRLNRIQQSPNFRDGQFQNANHTPSLTEGASYSKVLKEFFLVKNKRKYPATALPSHKADLLHLDPAKDVIVWFGHSSYFMQVDGKRILVDPVLSGSASPVKFTTKSFKGSDVYTVNDLPAIDYLFISHDHWDHLDHDTVCKLRSKVSKVITGLGVGEHLERWGYSRDMIIEKDWNEDVDIGDGFSVHTTTARHFSGRGFKRNGSLWVSFVLTTPHKKLFLGGDSGYDEHFRKIGDQYGPFDLVILENGQYNKNWKYIHMMPEEVVQAAIDLKAKRLMPVHWSKFALSLHDWDDPIIRVEKEARRLNMPILHPLIGELTDLNNIPTQKTWWLNVG